MTSPVRLWSVALALPTLHFLLHVGFGAGPWVPDLLTLGLLIVARELRSGTAAGVGFGLGLLEDAFSVLSFGANAMALTLVGILGSRSRDLFVGESLIFVVSYFAVGTWLRLVLHWLFAGGALGPRAGELLLVHGPALALYTAITGVVIVRLSGIWRGEVGR